MRFQRVLQNDLGSCSVRDVPKETPSLPSSHPSSVLAAAPAARLVLASACLPCSHQLPEDAMETRRDGVRKGELQNRTEEEEKKVEAWKPRSKVCCGQKWTLLLSPVFLLFLTVCVMAVTLPLPLPPFDVGQRWSRSLSSASEQPIIPGEDREREQTAKQRPNRRKSVPELTGNIKATKQRSKVKVRFRGGGGSPDAGQEDGDANRRTEKLRRRPGETGGVGKQQQAPEKPLGDVTRRHRPSEDSRKSPSLSLSQPGAGPEEDDGEVCVRLTERHLSAVDRRRVGVGPALRPPPWLSEDDLRKMELLAGGEVLSKARLPAHGQVLQVALDPDQRGVTAEPHGQRCQRGVCALVKRTEDWFEVFAFHLDRVLGLNRSLPAVLRTFRSQILPYRYTSGVPRPVVWWDPDIRHLPSRDNDQNSVPLSWVQYQKMLQIRCGIDAGLGEGPCVGVHHSEWARLALFDFLLQVNDRLDRYCCGFSPDPTEPCVENMLRAKCGGTGDLLLVHILVRKADPSRLVFIDNSGRPHQSADNLNFRLVEGINEFPEKAVAVLQSGCLENLLLHSLYTDREFWESQGGADGLRPLIRSVERRAKVLLQHIRDKKLQLKRDL